MLRASSKSDLALPSTPSRSSSNLDLSSKNGYPSPRSHPQSFSTPSKPQREADIGFPSPEKSLLSSPIAPAHHASSTYYSTITCQVSQSTQNLVLSDEFNGLLTYTSVLTGENFAFYKDSDTSAPVFLPSLSRILYGVNP